MASTKILQEKQNVVEEITSKLDSSESVILFSYRGLTVADIAELRKELRDNNSEVKIYKNTLLKRALDGKNINLDEFLEGPNAVIFGATVLEPIKVLSNFQKTHDNAKIQTGVINGEVVTLDTINEYASIPSMEGLLTMLAGGMIEHVKNLSIGLNLYAEKLGEEN